MTKRIFGLLLFAVFLAGCTVSVSPGSSGTTSAPTSKVLSSSGVDIQSAVEDAWSEIPQATKEAFCRDYRVNAATVTFRMGKAISDTSESTLRIINNYFKTAC